MDKSSHAKYNVMILVLHFYIQTRKAENDMFDENGLLPAGLHAYEQDAFINDFVTAFASSQTRKPLYNAFNDLLSEIISVFIPVEIWVDGSYATSKNNPNDIDLVMFLNLEDFIKPSNRVVFQALRDRYSGKLDVYFALAINNSTKSKLGAEDFQKATNKRNYWKGQFGFDRQDQPKGFVILGESVINAIVKGDRNYVSN